MRHSPIGSTFVGALVLVVAAAIAILASISASPDHPPSIARSVRVGTFDRARLLETCNRSGVDARRLERLRASLSEAVAAIAPAVAKNEDVVVIAELPTWSGAGVELVDVTAALAARFAREKDE